MNILREGACSYMHVYFKLENTTRIYKGKRQSTEIKSTMKFEHAFCFFSQVEHSLHSPII